MRGIFLSRERRQVEDISRRIDDSRRLLHGCVQESRRHLSDTVASPLGLAVFFGAGFFSSRHGKLVSRVPNPLRASPFYKFGLDWLLGLIGGR